MYTNIVIKIFLIINFLNLCLGDDYYEILGVSKTADQKEIREAFKKLAVIEHPDKNNDDPKAQEKFIRLSRAYETLKDPDLRKKYDAYGEEGLDASNKGTYHSWSYYANNFGIYDDDPRVITLEKHDYFENVNYSEKVWLVNFYSPMCSHCHRIAPAWKNIAEEFEGAVRIGAVNCEDEWDLCRQIGIRSYPTILHFPKNSKNGIRYSGEKTYTAITNFILENLEVDIPDIDEPLDKLIAKGRRKTKTPQLIFICGAQRNCFTYAERLKVAAVFENTVDVRIVSCDQVKKCDNTVSLNTGAVYLPPYTKNSWKAVHLDLEDGKLLIQKILEQLPEPRDLDDDDFENIRKFVSKNYDSGWLICFYIGRDTELELTLKRLASIIKTVKLAKINCGRYSLLCNDLSVNRYPLWGVLKPGGAFELNHGKNTINDIIKFFESSIKAKNVWALSADEVLSIIDKKNGEAWFLDWYAPWCPPCMQFLKQVRKASLEFDKSVVRFGTIDCTVHTEVCLRYNIRSYPTAMLLNGSDTHKFIVEKTADNIVQFINEVRDPSVEQLTSINFEERVARRKDKYTWIIEYFAPWCAPCQRLAPEWIVVAKSLSVLPFMKVASVNCEDEIKLCRSQKVRNYPTIRMYSSESNDLNNSITYNDQQYSVSILNWITNFFPRQVRDLDAFDLLQEALRDKNLWIIDFFVPSCQHCWQIYPQFSIAAQLSKRRVQFGRFNCDKYVSECVKAGIKMYPTLMAYDPRYNDKKIMNGFVINGTTAEVIKRNILDFTVRVEHDEL